MPQWGAQLCTARVLATEVMTVARNFRTLTILFQLTFIIIKNLRISELGYEYEFDELNE